MSKPQGPESAMQAEYWNGRAGAAWAELQERMDASLAPVSDALMSAANVAVGERVLDVGCGAGETTLRIAEAVGPGGFVVGCDVSEPLTVRARARAGARSNVRFALADAATATHPEAPFDLIASRFGVMFFGDPPAAFAHLARSLRPGGRIAFACWRDLSLSEWMTLPMRAVEGVLPPSPPSDPTAPGPGSLADERRTRALLEGAGWDDVTISPVDVPLSFGRDVDDALFQIRRIGPLARLLAEAPKPDAERAIEAVRAALSARASLEANAAIWIVRGRRPG